MQNSEQRAAVNLPGLDENRLRQRIAGGKDSAKAAEVKIITLAELQKEKDKKLGIASADDEGVVVEEN